MMKLTELPTSSSLSTDDLLYIVDNPGGTPNSYKATIGSVLDLMDTSDFALLSQSNTFTGTQKIGAVGGTAGRTLDLYHDDSNAYVESKYGGIYLTGGAGQSAYVNQYGQVKSSIFSQVGSDHTTLSSSGIYMRSTGSVVGWSSTSSADTPDTQLSRNTGGGILGTTTQTGADLLTLQAPASHTGNLLDLTNSVGTRSAWFDYYGTLTIKGTDGSGRKTHWIGSLDETLAYVSQTGGLGVNELRTLGSQVILDPSNVYMRAGFHLRFSRNASYGDQDVDAGLTSPSAGVIKVTDGSTGNGSLTASVLNCDLSNSALGFSINSGNWGAAFKNANVSGAYVLSRGDVGVPSTLLKSSASDVVPLAIQLASGQTANGFELLDSVGSLLLGINPSGILKTTGSFSVQAHGGSNNLTVTTASVFGTGDTFFQTSTTGSGYGVFECSAGVGTAISTSADTPVILAPNRTEKLRATGSGIFLSGVPTSDPGVSGQIWNDSGTLKISA